MLNFSSGKIFV